MNSNGLATSQSDQKVRNLVRYRPRSQFTFQQVVSENYTMRLHIFDRALPEEVPRKTFIDRAQIF